MMRRIGASVAFALIGLLFTPAKAQDVSGQITDLLDSYGRGEYGRAVHEGVTSAHLSEWRRAYPKAARAWIGLANADVQKRRLIAGGLIVEIAQACYEQDATAWTALRGAIEDARSEIRRGPATDGERAWYRALVAFGGRTRDRDAADEDVVGAWRRFPDDPFFWTAKALLLATKAGTDADIDFLTSRPYMTMMTGDVVLYQGHVSVSAARQQILAGIRELMPAVPEPVWGPYAEAHVAWRLVMLHDYGEALAHARQAEARARAAKIRYLGALLSGMAYEGLGSTGDARAAYRRATSLVDGQSAALRLAVITQNNPADDADATGLVERSLMPIDADPYRMMRYGMYTFWPEMIQQFHEALR